MITGKPRREQVWDYPLEALREAVVNAVCHRDYGDTADIQIKVFDDHIRIWSPGFLPFGVTIEDLYRRTHASRPRNKLIAQVFYDLEIIERYGSGIQRMLDACKDAGLPEPTLEESTGGFLITFRKAAQSAYTATATQQVTGEVAGEVTGEVTGEVGKLLAVLHLPMSRQEAQAALNLRSQANFRERYLLPALASGAVEMTIPDKPRSSLQRYRLTEKGRICLAAQPAETQATER